MAWTVQGTAALDFVGSNPAAQNLTIPSGCKLVAVFFTYYAANGATVSTPTLGGTNMTAGAALPEAGDATATYCFYRINPASGTLALDPAFSNVPSEGPLCQIVYVTADGTVSVIDSDADAKEGGTTASVTSTSNTGDLAIGLAQKFNGAPTIGGTGAANIASGSHSFNSEHGQLFTVTAGASTSTLTSANDYSSVCSIILRETGGGGSTYTLAVTQAVLDVAAATANLNLGRVLPATQAVLDVAANTANVNLGRRLTVAQAILDVAAAAASLLTNYRLTAAQRALSLATNSVGLNYGRALPVAQAVLDVAASASLTLNFGYSLPVAQGALDVAAASVSLLTAYRLTAAQAALLLASSSSTSVNLGRRLTVAQAALVLAAPGVALTRAVVAQVTQGHITLSAASVVLTASGAYVLVSAQAGLVVGAPTIALVRAATLGATQGVLDVAAAPAGLLYARALPVAQHALLLTAPPAGLALGGSTTLQVTRGLLALAGHVGLNGPPGSGGAAEGMPRGRGRSRRL